MRFWKSVKRFFAGEGALHYAANDGDLNAVKSLLADGFAINEIFNTGNSAYTPLGSSLLWNAYGSAIFLLEQKADPNIKQPLGLLPQNVGKAIQPYLYFYFSPDNTLKFNAYMKQRNASIIRLLTWYGTTEENLTFYEDPNSLPFKLLFFKIRACYKEKIQLDEKLKSFQQDLNEEPDNEKLKEAQTTCLKLSALWEGMYQEEKPIEDFDNSAFRIHYQKKSDFYKKLAKKYEEGLSFEITTNNSSSDPMSLPAASIFRRRNQTALRVETEPLLPPEVREVKKKL